MVNVFRKMNKFIGPLRIAISQSLFSETLLTDNYDITEYEFLEETDNLISIILKCDRHLWKGEQRFTENFFYCTRSTNCYSMQQPILNSKFI